MRRQFLFSTVIAAAMAVGVGAQQSSPSQYPSSQSSSDKAVTVTGCVERGTGGATGTTGSTQPGATAGSSTSSSDFVLKNVMQGSSSTTGSTAGTTGSSTALPSSATTEGLKLIASASDDLDKYAGKKVEVKGTIEKAGESGSTAGSTSAPGSTAGSTGSMSSGASSQGKMASLRVTSIRETSGSCSGGQK